MSWSEAATDWLRRRPVVAPVAVGALLRTIAAFTGFGWFAAVDYTWVVQQAWRWLVHPNAPFGSVMRSPLLARFVWLLMRAGQGLGIHDPALLLQVCYLVLGLVSLGVIPAVYLLSRRRLGDNAALVAAWLAAAFVLMPRITTRALLGVVAMLPLAWGLVALDRSDIGRRGRRWWLAAGGGLLLGVAAMLRFQVGLVCVAAFGVLVWRALRAAVGERRWAWGVVVGLVVGGLVTVGLQIALDVHLGRGPFGTLLAYLRYNAGHAQRYGVSPWYTYLLQLIAMTAPPATLMLWRPFVQAMRRHALVTVSLVVFVVVHSLVPHKEDRFLFPILPLFFVLLAAALVQAYRVRPWGRRAVIFFAVINLAGLVIATTSDSGRSMTVPLLQLNRRGANTRLAAVHFAVFPFYYAGSAVQVQAFPNVTELMHHLKSSPWRPNYILFRRPGDVDRKALAAVGLHCDAPVRYTGDWVDRMALRLNPAHNKRRRPTALVRCGTASGSP